MGVFSAVRQAQVSRLVRVCLTQSNRYVLAGWLVGDI